MSAKRLGRKTAGFTLVELLVVIAIIALLVAIVFPAISTAMLRGRVTATSVNGRNIHQAIVGESVASPYGGAVSPWPDRDSSPEFDGQDLSYNTTGEYFAFLVRSEAMNVAWSFFAPPGIQAAENQADLEAGQHGWRVVNRAENLPDTAPFLFTSNITDGYTNLSSSPHSLLVESTEHPFQDQGFAFVTRGGAAYALVGGDLHEREEDRFDRLFVRRRRGGQEGDYLDNDVLLK